MYPNVRMRRMRKSAVLRSLVRETHLHTEDLIYPLFIVAGEGVREEISSLPGVFRHSVDRLKPELDELCALGIRAVLLFGIPEQKDDTGQCSLETDGPVQRAIREIKAQCPEMIVMTDVCLCEYTTHGHCGLLTETGEVDNDRTLPVLVAQALSHAECGADLVAPSDMMDGRVGAIRKALDEQGFTDVGIMAYAAKFASAFYGPFREAADCAPQFGDRKAYQMDPANSMEAMREVALDVKEGADIVMVKPALAYLDIVHKIKERFQMPTAAYHVSGEYAMVKAAAQRGWLDEERAMMESLLSIRRGGADLIITYYAKEAARILKEGGA